MSTPQPSRGDQNDGSRKLKKWLFGPRVTGSELDIVSSPSTIVGHTKGRMTRSQSQSQIDMPRIIEGSTDIEKLKVCHVRARSQDTAAIKNDIGFGLRVFKEYGADQREGLTITTPILPSTKHELRKMMVFSSRSYDALNEPSGWVKGTRQYYSSNTQKPNASCSKDNLEDGRQIRARNMQSIRETLYGPQRDMRGRKRKGEFPSKARKNPPSTAMRNAGSLLKPPPSEYRRRGNSPVRRLVSISSGLNWTGHKFSSEIVAEDLKVTEPTLQTLLPEVVVDSPVIDETDQQLSKQAARALVFTTPHVFRTLASLRKDLLKATANGYSNRVRELLDRDDVLTFRDAFNENNGLTPLHYAVQNEHHYILQMLLDVDSDLTAMSNAAETPLDTAIRMENTTATRMLREAHLTRALRETGLKSPAMTACSRSLRALVVKHSDSSSVNTEVDSYAETSSTLAMSLQGPIRVEVFQEDCGPWYDRHTLYKVTVTNERPRSSSCEEIDSNEYSVFKRFKVP